VVCFPLLAHRIEGGGGERERDKRGGKGEGGKKGGKREKRNGFDELRILIRSKTSRLQKTWQIGGKGREKGKKGA